MTRDCWGRTLSRLRHWVWIVGLVAGVGLLVLTHTARADVPGQPEDPLALGAWLYTGQCVRCHGPYEQRRIGRGLDEDRLRLAIRDGDGCAVAWGRAKGGPLKNSEIDAIVLYIQTWEELGHAPDLPPLPAQPTATPTPTRSTPLQATPTAATPTPVIDELTRLIISGNRLALGAWLYTQHCYRCHLGYEEARQGNGRTREVVKETIANGKTATNMRPFSRVKGGPLKNAEIDAIVLYIFTWEQLGAPPALPEALFLPPTPDPRLLTPVAPPQVPVVQGDSQRGRTLYAAYCATCHGTHGQGDQGPALVKAWRAVRPDLTLRATIARGVPRSLMPAWDQAAGGPLSDQDIPDLISLILSWSPPPTRQWVAIDQEPTPAVTLSAILGLGLGLLLGSLVWLVVRRQAR
jgi:mono/diheme cytochrome c family protein